ncbi:MAG TPA: hydrogenase 4 subunit F [Stellaceae bacterium]|jgi:hydrogenase-4 component F|nr:hydrogenase 4 subunit F [Stellaceae bacterium]
MNVTGWDAAAAVLLIPLLAACILALLPHYRAAALLNIGATFLTLLAAVALLVGPAPPSTDYLLVDELNIVFIALSSFIGFTTSIFSASYIGHELETERLTPTYLRFYHAMYQILMFAMNLALLANNIGLMWVAIEIATLTTVMMVGIYRTHEALEAAWKYFILGSVGIGLALFGTILVYVAAQPVIGEGVGSMVWTQLVARAAGFDPALLNVAFVFLLLGYGTKVGLVPLHAWLPDAHAEGPTPISAVLSGLLLNVALYAVLRFKMLMTANAAAVAPGPLMVTLGLLSVIFAAFMLYRRRDIKRLFAYSSIEHMGIIVFAFGMGGPLANFAGLLHMTMHSLTKSGIFFTVGHVTQVKGTQRIAEIGGLTETHAWLGWSLVIGVVAIAGLPPFGIFMSEFLVVSSSFARSPLLTLLLVFGLLIALGALILRLNSIAFGAPRGPSAQVRASYAPLIAHFALVLAIGIYLPAPLVAWFQQVAALLG